MKALGEDEERKRDEEDENSAWLICVLLPRFRSNIKQPQYYLVCSEL